MKRFVIPLLILTGCCHAAPVATLPQPRAAEIAKPVAPPPSPPPAPVPDPLEARVKQQQQFIEALLSQNEALAAKLAAPASTPAPVAEPKAAAPTPAPVAVAATSPVPTPTELTANAEGVIDLATPPAAKPGEAVNPFAVRTVDPASVRELSVHVTGIIDGPVRCAVANGRILQAGDVLESLTVERIEPTALVARVSGKPVRLTVTEKPIRIRTTL